MRIVSKIRHLTGSMFRGANAEINRPLTAACLREYRRLCPGRRTYGANAIGMLRPRISAGLDAVSGMPRHDFFFPRHGIGIAVAQLKAR